MSPSPSVNLAAGAAAAQFTAPLAPLQAAMGIDGYGVDGHGHAARNAYSQYYAQQMMPFATAGMPQQATGAWVGQ